MIEPHLFRLRRARAAIALVVAAFAGPAQAAGAAEAPEVARARYLWAQSPHGRMLERILPRAIEPHELPEPRSEGARLAARYCVQCHYLPNPRMHSREQWGIVVVRMVWRMRGNGNLGEVMKDMMEGVQAPTESETATLTRYFQKHAQQEMDPRHPALRTEAGRIYAIACTQCHALPDPRQHVASEWPAIVERMKRHMAWANTVVGAHELRTVPVLDTREIVRFLQRHAAPQGASR